MRTYKTSVEISAPVEKVWRILVEEMPRTPKPFGIIQFEGNLSLNARITLWSEVSPNKAFALTVVAFQPLQKMVWQGGMPFGMFVGTRSFDLSSSSASTKFEMQEDFTGPLAGMITKSIPDLTPNFEKFANALKEKAE